MAQRIGWLSQTETYNSEAYQQLAQQYRAGGNEEAARKILIASQRDLRKRGKLRWISGVWNWFLGWSVGYGYRLHRPFLFVLALGLIGWGIYFWGEHAGLIYASYTWTTIAIGWLAGTAIIAGVTRFFRAR